MGKKRLKGIPIFNLILENFSSTGVKQVRTIKQPGRMEKSFQVNIDLLRNSLNWMQFCEVWIFLQRFSSCSLEFMMFYQLVDCVLFEGPAVAYSTFSHPFFPPDVIWIAFDCLELCWAPALTWQRDVSVSVSRCIPPCLFCMLPPCPITTAFIVASDRSSCRHRWKTWPSLLIRDL